MRANRSRAAAPRRPNPRHVYSRGPRIRAGMVVSRHMDFGGVADVETMMADEGLTLAPITVDGRPVERVVGPAHVSVLVLPTADITDVAEGSLAGMVVPGTRGEKEPEGERTFARLVKAAHARDVPVMAFGEGVPRTLDALGYEALERPPAGLMIHNGALILETPDDVRDALKVFVTPQGAP